MSFVTRKRAVAAGIVAAFVVALAIVGVISRGTSNTVAPPTATVTSAVKPIVPTATWYWTMAVAPTDPNVLVVGTSTGLLRSIDGGKTWKPTGPKNVDTTSVVVSGTALFAGGSALSPEASPVVEKGSNRAAADGKAMLETSTDGGKTWKAIHPRGLPAATVQSLTVDPTNGRTLYALENTGKLYRSTDGAHSFHLASAKLGIPPWAIALAGGGRFLGGNMDTGAYQSSNGGSAWQHSTFSDARGDTMVMEYAVQPNDPTHVLMTVYGIESSTDGGKTWHTALPSSVMFGPVAYAPSSPEVAYAIGFDSSLWRSNDGGKTWAEVS